MIFSETNQLYITDSYLRLERKNDYNLSVIPLSNSAQGVTLKGVYYQLNDAEMVQGTSLGISNKFTDEYAEVFVKKGLLLIVLAKDSLN